MGRTKDQYIDYLNTLDQEDSQNREIQDRKPDNNQSGSLRNNLNHLDKQERDRNVIDDTLRSGDEGRGLPRQPRRRTK